MAKNRLFGWMFVEDSNKESETVKPRTSQEYGCCSQSCRNFCACSHNYGIRRCRYQTGGTPGA